MKRKLCALFLSALLACSSINVISVTADDIETMAANIAAFPGAEGGGKFATGGRGGKVVYVTNLNDSGAGSFRDAVSGSNRIVVFKVGGTIELKSDVVVKSNVTVAGQTAPGGNGITLKNYKIGLGGSNIILRYVNSRPGERGTNADYDALGGSDGSGSIVDHCSFSWANDEQWGLYSNNTNCTTQWSVIGPSNSFSYHSKGIHGFGVMFGKANHTMHHNMIVHNVSRNFRGKVEKTNTVDFVNNVIYNWGYQTAYGTLGHLNYVGNYLKKGPSTQGGNRYVSVGDSGTAPENYSIYLTGNKFVNPDGTDYSTLSDNNWTGITYGSSSGKNEANTRSNSAFAMKVNGVDVSVAKTAESAEDAFNHVLQYSGAGINSTSRSSVDQQVMEEARTGTGSMVGARPYNEANSTQKATIDQYKIACGTVFEYPAKITTGAPLDSDSDGMPDEWELARGLNPYSKYANDGTLEANNDYCGQGYTNIEYYINDLTVDSFPEGTVTVSPTLGASVTVNPNAEEQNGSDASRKTISSAVQYMTENGSNFGRQTITLTAGTYNEDVIINIPNVTMETDGSQNVTINGNLTVTSNAADFQANNITFNGLSTVSGDKAVFENCSITNSGTALNIKDNARFYIKDTTVKGNGDIMTISSQGIIEGGTIISDNSESNAVVSNIDQNSKYGILIKDCSVKSVKSLGKADSTYGQIVYYNCTYDGIAAGNDRWSNMDDSKKSSVRFVECNTSTDLSSVSPSFASIVSEAVLLEEYNPFHHTCGTDGWNPGGWDELTPQETLKNLADSLSLPTSIITENTAVTTGFSDSSVSISWTASDNTLFSNNTILIGDYGAGVKNLTLTATVSKPGLTDEVRTFKLLVGSHSYNPADIITFDNEPINSIPEYFKDSADDTTGVSSYVTDNINGTTFKDRGNFYKIDQTATTGTVIHNFDYNFGTQADKVFEVGYDVYIDEITNEGYFESYVRGSNALGQIRYTSADGATSIEAYQNPTTRVELATSNSGEWYKFKILVDSRGVENGTQPTINYYIYDSKGTLKASLKNCAPAKDYSTATDYTAFIPNKLEFRPNRNYAKCEFYVDNLYFKDYTQLAADDANALSVGTLNMSGSDSLNKYGDHMSTVTWRVVDGAEELVNSNGTINYNKCKNATVKVKGSVTIGSDIKASADTQTITLNITGTGSSNPTVATADFSDTDDFSSWIAQFNQASVINLAHMANVSGNTTSKIEASNKAVFKVLDKAVGTGKATLSLDFLNIPDGTNTTGRTFRIYLENTATANSNGSATADFDNNNIFYHLMDYSNVPRVMDTDTPTANTEVGIPMNTSLEANKWYRVTVEIDLDNATAVTNIYSHGNNGTYAPDNISAAPIAANTSALISKSPLQLKQIRLVRTAGSIVYFDNISLKTDSDTPPVTDITYGDVDSDGYITGNDAALILQYSLNRSSIPTDNEWVEKADVDGDDVITANDAAEVYQKSLNSSYNFSRG